MSTWQEFVLQKKQRESLTSGHCLPVSVQYLLGKYKYRYKYKYKYKYKYRYKYKYKSLSQAEEQGEAEAEGPDAEVI